MNQFPFTEEANITMKTLVALCQPFFVFLLLIVAMPVGEVLATETDEPIQITLYPAAEPTPALKYRLLPKFIDRKPGNAAVFYGKVTAERGPFFRNRELRDKMERWRSAPLSDLLSEEARVPFKPRYLRKAALCRSCDWQLSLHEGRYFGMLLPEVQQTREFARILATQARIQIAHGEYEQAIHSFQTCFALGRNVASGETLVHDLIGVAISSLTMDQMLEFVQQPDAPNLYWATTMLPRPFVDMRDGMEAEMSLFELSFPELHNLESKRLSPEAGQKLLHDFSHYFALLSDQDSKLGRAAIYLKMQGEFPVAKESLIEQAFTEKAIEAMSKEQVMALHFLHSYKHRLQDLGKYYHLPYRAAIEGMSAAIDRAEDDHSEFTKVLKMLKRAREAIAKNTRRFEVLRILEALRIHAAANGGKLPAKLDDITEVPIPLDPVTGKPFEYQLTGETATLQGPAILDTPLNYVITMKRKVDKP